MSPSIAIAEYDPEWPAQFNARAQRVQAALGERIARIEHVGEISG
jgi:GrpB-like predicted nucleotidyltransferase (UPF0157 family)